MGKPEKSCEKALTTGSANTRSGRGNHVVWIGVEALLQETTNIASSLVAPSPRYALALRT